MGILICVLIRHYVQRAFPFIHIKVAKTVRPWVCFTVWFRLSSHNMRRLPPGKGISVRSDAVNTTQVIPAGGDVSLPAWTEPGARTTALTDWLMDTAATLPSSVSLQHIWLGVAKWINPGICSGAWSDVAVLAAAAATLEVTVPTDLSLTTCWLLHSSFPPLSPSDLVHHLWWTLNSFLIGVFSFTKFDRAGLGGYSVCHEAGWWWVCTAGDSCSNHQQESLVPKEHFCTA